MCRRNMWGRGEGVRRSCSIISVKNRCLILENIRCFGVFVVVIVRTQEWMIREAFQAYSHFFIAFPFDF